MSSETPNPAADPENAKDQQQTDQGSVLKDAYDVQDLAYTSSANIDTEEIGTNPALAPETIGLNEPDEIREGFKFDRD